MGLVDKVEALGCDGVTSDGGEGLNVRAAAAGDGSDAGLGRVCVCVRTCGRA